VQPEAAAPKCVWPGPWGAPGRKRTSDRLLKVRFCLGRDPPIPRLISGVGGGTGSTLIDVSLGNADLLMDRYWSDYYSSGSEYSACYLVSGGSVGASLYMNGNGQPNNYTGRGLTPTHEQAGGPPRCGWGGHRRGSTRPILGIGRSGDEDEGRRRSMFERFTDRARRVVVRAQEEARTLDHDYVGTEHLLLGLTHESIGGVAARALESLGVGREAVRQRVEEVTGRGEQAPSGRIPFTPQAKEVLKLALDESVQLGHHYIGTEHILLGLIRAGDGVAAQVLTGLGADLDGAREQVIRVLDEYQRGHRTE
jgi:Clp amino terminal domain, pathogenicity island component